MIQYTSVISTINLLSSYVIWFFRAVFNDLLDRLPAKPPTTEGLLQKADYPCQVWFEHDLSESDENMTKSEEGWLMRFIETKNGKSVKEDRAHNMQEFVHSIWLSFAQSQAAPLLWEGIWLEIKESYFCWMRHQFFEFRLCTWTGRLIWLQRKNTSSGLLYGKAKISVYSGFRGLLWQWRILKYICTNTILFYLLTCVLFLSWPISFKPLLVSYIPFVIPYNYSQTFYLYYIAVDILVNHS